MTEPRTEAGRALLDRLARAGLDRVADGIFAIENEAAALASDDGREGLADDVHAADMAAWLIGCYLYERPVLSGTTPPSKQQAIEAVVTVRSVLARLSPDTHRDDAGDGLDVERLAEATARVVGLHGANDYHREWAVKVVAEYARLREHQG